MKTLKHLPLKPSVIHGEYNITLGQRRYNPNKKTTKLRKNKSISKIDSTKLTPLTSTIKPSNGVYTTKINEKLYYYKPQAEEHMQVKNSKGVMEFLRKGIKNDRLFEREELSYKISKELGLDIIPHTKTVKDERGRDGVIQRSAHEHEQSKSPNTKIELLKHTETSWKSILDTLDKGNGMDVVLFDFITGNADRNASNFYIRKDNNHIIGIDNGLSFPVQKHDALSSDAYKTSKILWKAAFSSPDAKISNEFMTKLKDFKTFDKISKILLKSKIEPDAKYSTLFRLSALMEHIKKNNMQTFDSIDFATLLHPFIKNMEIKDTKDKRFKSSMDESMKLGYEAIKNPNIKKKMFGL